MLNAAARALLGKISPTEVMGKELHKTKNIVKGIYNFATQGGSVGNLELFDDDGERVQIPAKAVVTRSWSEVITTCTSGGAATVALKMVGDADLQAATAVASLTAGAFIEGEADGAAANFVKQSGSAPATLLAQIGTAALTAGKIAFYAEYVLSE